MSELRPLEYKPAQFRDIPKTLRALADKIESGYYGNCDTALLVLEAETGDEECPDSSWCKIFEMGDRTAADSIRDIGLLTIALVQMAVGATDTDQYEEFDRAS